MSSGAFLQGAAEGSRTHTCAVLTRCWRHGARASAVMSWSRRAKPSEDKGNVQPFKVRALHQRRLGHAGASADLNGSVREAGGVREPERAHPSEGRKIPLGALTRRARAGSNCALLCRVRKEGGRTCDQQRIPAGTVTTTAGTAAGAAVQPRHGSTRRRTGELDKKHGARGVA